MENETKVRKDVVPRIDLATALLAHLSVECRLIQKAMRRLLSSQTESGKISNDVLAFRAAMEDRAKVVYTAVAFLLSDGWNPLFMGEIEQLEARMRADINALYPDSTGAIPLPQFLGIELPDVDVNVDHYRAASKPS